VQEEGKPGLATWLWEWRCQLAAGGCSWREVTLVAGFESQWQLPSQAAGPAAYSDGTRAAMAHVTKKQRWGEHGLKPQERGQCGKREYTHMTSRREQPKTIGALNSLCTHSDRLLRTFPAHLYPSHFVRDTSPLKTHLKTKYRI
jgi:hypothetical protein